MNLTVLVGISKAPAEEPIHGPVERRKIAKAIGEYLPVVEVPFQFPRDHFVFNGGRYIVRRPNRNEYNVCGEGGCFHVGNNFVLVSEDLLNEDDPPYASQQAVREVVTQNFPGKSIHVVPMGFGLGARKSTGWLRHTDLTILPIESQKCLLVDMNLYSLNDGLRDKSTKQFQQIARALDWDLEIYNSERDSSIRYFPMNCLSIPKPGGELIFANKNVPGVLEILRCRGVDFVPIDVKYMPEASNASIRCVTNVTSGAIGLERLLNPLAG